MTRKLGEFCGPITDKRSNITLEILPSLVQTEQVIRYGSVKFSNIRSMMTAFINNSRTYLCAFYVK